MASWFYALILFGIGIAAVVGYGSLYLVSFIALIFNILFGWYLLPPSVSLLIYIINVIVWGKVLNDIWATRKVA